jgi:hypothetical protein
MTNYKKWFETTPIVAKNLKEVVDAIAEGSIRLPLYQRDSVWDEVRVCALWDSIFRKFPLPSFFLAEGLGDSRKISDSAGRAETEGGSNYLDLLDGQQRLTSILKGFALNQNPTLRLWIDLAPADSEKHPFQFQYWIHPCTSTFPFGFKMKRAGEHSFENLSDAEMREIGKCLQATQHQGKEFFEVPLTDSFPWEAVCPVPLDELLKLAFSGNSGETINTQIKDLAGRYKTKIAKIRPELASTSYDVSVQIEQLARTLFELSDYRIALQKTNAGADSFTLFERIGRGGVTISSRQLGVSRLILELGVEANDAIAHFQKGEWKDILDTEELIHAVARISYAGTQSPPDWEYVDNGAKLLQDFDLYDLDLQHIQTLKRNEEKWNLFIENMRENCHKLEQAFEQVFSKVLLHRRSSHFDFGFSLVQMAQRKSEGGIEPLTLHPLLYWAFYTHKDEDALTSELHRNMLQWLLFSNGVTKQAAHKKLNQMAFHKTIKHGKVDFNSIQQEVFVSFSDKELDELGLAWNQPYFDALKNEVVERNIKCSALPIPKVITERTLRRLLLKNWPDKSGVNNFVLMWNQRTMLDKLYGDIAPEFIHALYGKGRPIDADHIVARNLLSGHTTTVDPQLIEAAMRTLLPNSVLGSKIQLTNQNFRLHFPNLNGNFRYWPKFLNRSDQDVVVNEKLPLPKILGRLSDHVMTANKFTAEEDENIGWKWSAIQQKSSWENLPPSNKKWDATAISRFVNAVIEREFHLYAELYAFLTTASDIAPPLETFDIQKLILE